jgi:hypothetical protein
MYSEDIISIDGVLVRKEILTTPFLCDLKKCKGGCCTIESEYGAPVTSEEIQEIEKILDVVKEYLPENHLKQIEKGGFYDNIDGELMTSSYQNRACVFVYYEGEVAKCAIERAYFDGKTEFRKPVSCHLFPIRVAQFGGDILRYEKFPECEPALVNGAEKDSKIIDCCGEALERLYGGEWFQTLKKESIK